jgi:hypothetical protein
VLLPVSLQVSGPFLAYPSAHKSGFLDFRVHGHFSAVSFPLVPELATAPGASWDDLRASWIHFCTHPSRRYTRQWLTLTRVINESHGEKTLPSYIQIGISMQMIGQYR